MEVIAEAVPEERRSAERLEVIVPLDATINGKAAEIVDLSLSGALLRHSHGVTRGYVQLRFSWNRARFNEKVQLVSSRIAGITERGTSYESRVAFGAIGEESSTALEHALHGLYDRRLAAWVANLRGHGPADAGRDSGDHGGAYIVCTLVEGRWQRQRANARGHNPRNGFVVRDSVGEGEIRRICRAFAVAGDDGRELLRLFAHHVS